MKKLYLTGGLSVGLALASLSAQAQADFRPGYLVRLAGDTVRGQVNYRNARLGGTQCLFRAAGEQSSTTWLPNQVKGYGLRSGEHFTSQLTPMPMPAAVPGQVPAAGPPPARQVFLEVLAEGAASLLSWKDDQGGSIFTSKKRRLPSPSNWCGCASECRTGGLSANKSCPYIRAR